ncbi:hypothetical protein [Salinispira pacifica]|uniref:STAS/SEC14 domain-containing protein n=1 Tax=Salinispira pacifica TaxID=1307761 RepID=V5WHZ5_9SPIO|nr:hypothetical protein [Salinispira pacifica]AHC14791.1 hypothetical protein L21SP2_1392 [Salinispira pacifica]
MIFKEHGVYDISVQKRLLVVNATGPWNAEAAQHFASRVKATVLKNWTDETWAMIAILHGQGLYTEFSTPILKDLHAWRVAHGLRHIAIIHSEENPESSVLTEYQFDDIYRSLQKGSCVQRYFRSVGQGMEWMKALGYIST